MKQTFDFLIPKKLPNWMILMGYEVFRYLQKWFGKSNLVNVEQRQDAVKSLLKKENGFIENQHDFGAVSYGKSNMSAAGCEIFAVYNALQVLRPQSLSLDELIAIFEKDGMALQGKFGTSPKALQDYFQKNGFACKYITKAKQIENVLAEYDTWILTILNDKEDIRKQIHTIHISKSQRGYLAHNVYCNGKVVGPFDDFFQLMKNINGGKAKMLAMIGVKNNC